MATIALSGSAVISAGAGVGSVPSESWDHWIEQAEGYLSGLTKYDVVTNWGPSLSGSSVAPMLTEYCERFAAVEGIRYNTAAYDSTAEWEDALNVHLFRMEEIKKLLENADVQDFMGV